MSEMKEPLCVEVFKKSLRKHEKKGRRLNKKCMLCDLKCDGNTFIIRDLNEVEPIMVCDECLNDFANHNYDKLCRKVIK